MMTEFTLTPFFTLLEDILNSDNNPSVKPKDFYCEREFPGVKKEEIAITSTSDTIVLQIHSTRYQNYSEKFTLSEKMYDYSNIKAAYSDGLLKINVPLLKTEEKKESKRIEIE